MGMTRKPRTTTTEGRIAIGYARVSTMGQATEGVSLEAQTEQIRGYCKANGYELLHIHIDAGISGKRADNRPELAAALRSVCKAKGVLVVAKLDRLARSTRDAIDMAQRVEACGADLASVKDQLDTGTPMGRFAFRLLASLGELERDIVAERTREALAYKRSKGHRISGVIPFGHDLADDGEGLIENQTEQRTIDRMIELRDAGHGYAKVASILTAELHKPKHAAAWSAETIRQVLRRVERERQAA